MALDRYRYVTFSTRRTLTDRGTEGGQIPRLVAGLVVAAPFDPGRPAGVVRPGAHPRNRDLPGASDPWNLDQYRCTEVDGEGDGCQLVVGHDAEHMLQKAGQRVVWPIGADPQTRPPWATTFPRG